MDPNGCLQDNWFVVVYLLIHSVLNHDYGRRVSCVRGFSGDRLYCSAHPRGLQGKCFPRWAGNLRNVAVVHSLPDMFSKFFKYSRGKHICFGALNSSDIFECDFAEEPWEVPSKLICLSTQFHEKTRRALAFDMTTYLRTSLSCFCFVTAMIVILSLWSIVSTILFLASNIGNHTCLEHYAGIWGIVLCVCATPDTAHHNIFTTLRTYLCVRIICIIQCRITKIYIYMRMSRTVWDNVSKKYWKNRFVNRLNPPGIC